jgi:hypothetical protein
LIEVKVMRKPETAKKMVTPLSQLRKMRVKRPLEMGR